MAVNGGLDLFKLVHLFQWRIQDFPDKGANPWVWGKNCMKIKEIGPGAHAPGAPFGFANALPLASTHIETPSSAPVGKRAGWPPLGHVTKCSDPKVLAAVNVNKKAFQ